MYTSIETHPFPAFVPGNSRTLILGSFPGKESTQEKKRPDDWYYGANRNQFWKILELVYGRELRSQRDKQKLFEDYGIAITDIIKSCKRAEGSSADKNLTEKVYNTEVIKKIIEGNNIEKILFTSKGVEKEFTTHIEPHIRNRQYQKIVLITPSPAYLRDSVAQKAEKYRLQLPSLTIRERHERLRDRFGGEGFTVLK